MPDIKKTALFGKLNRIGYRSVEAATVFCKMRGNPFVEVVHWIHQLLQLPATDLHAIVGHFGLDHARLAEDLTACLDRLPRGSTAISAFSPLLESVVERGWVYATLMFGESRVRSGHAVIGILKKPGLRNALMAISEQFEKIGVDELTADFAEITSGSPEESLPATDGLQVGGGAVPGEASGAIAPAQMGKQEALRQFSVDLTERARNGEVDPIVGRDVEIRQIVDILMRRRQNNPILTGEAGVGKTAVVEGLARWIASGDVPPPLRDVSIRTLDVGLLQAGASMKGEFENRLRAVIEEVQSSERPIVLFIDEAHTLVGAGGAAGTGDAANLLKPALARGKLRTIAATTWSEYKKHIEKDPALTRRFQVVSIDEPSEDRAISMMRAIAWTLEEHHRVQLLDEGIEAAVRLSHRYIPERQLPDKALSLLDTACARVAISQYAAPAGVEASRREVDALTTELEIIGRESVIGVDTTSREASANERIANAKRELEALEVRWNEEKELVAQILELRKELRVRAGVVEPASGDSEAALEGGAAPGDANGLLDELRGLQSRLDEMQGERPLILPSVDAHTIGTVVSDWTGIPVGRMIKNEVEAVLRLGDTLSERVIGQRHALDAIARRIQTSRASLDNPNKPIGVFLLCGPSGVGKTETALTLAEALYGGEQNLITLNMSEFQEAHTVSTLKGSPPGYVGYGEGGVLTEAVRRRPYSVVLLDEMEKAHRDVHEMFFQVFDKGWMEDAEGRAIDFKNTLILVTSNVGTDLIMEMCADPDLIPEPDGLAEALRQPLLKEFPAALLGRLVVLPYFPLSDDVLKQIVELQIARIQKRIEENHGVALTYDDEVVDVIRARCTEVESGARTIDSILTNTILPAISQEFLARTIEGLPMSRIHIEVRENKFAYTFDSP